MSTDAIKPWDSDHTALVHVLWAAESEGITIGDADALASHIMQSKWMSAVRAHERARLIRDSVPATGGRPIP